MIALQSPPGSTVTANPSRRLFGSCRPAWATLRPASTRRLDGMVTPNDGRRWTIDVFSPGSASRTWMRIPAANKAGEDIGTPKTGRADSRGGVTVLRVTTAQPSTTTDE